MKMIRIVLVGVMVAGIAVQSQAVDKPLKVVTTLPDYAVIAQAIGGDRIEAQAIVKGEQDAHYIRPKPSFVDMVKKADVLIDTGLDLEIWLPTVIDKSGNKNVRSGRDGYIAASRGMRMLEKPVILSRSEGGVHIYGNPHVTSSPINIRVAAQNIATGLIKNDPAGRFEYEEGLKKFLQQIDERMFGKRLVEILGGDTLCDLASERKLLSFLEEQTFRNKPLIKYLGGWTKTMQPLRKAPIVTYHNNWLYFVNLFELEAVGTVEPKPGIPPSPKHVLGLTKMMKERQIKIILAANYFDEHKIQTIANKVGAEAVIVPLYVGGSKNADDYFKLVDLWVNSILKAAKKQDVI